METALNTKFIGVRRFVTALKLELPFDRAQIIQELENEAWVPHGEVAPVGHNPWPNTRYKCLRPQWKNQALTAVSRYFGSLEFKRRAIDWMYQEYHGIYVTWGMSAEEMEARTPEDIAVNTYEDIVARQLREAALAEDDPELRERLWEEYRKYTGMK